LSSETQTWGPEIRVELVIGDSDPKKYFALLEAQTAEIETEIGQPLTWHNPPEKKSCKIYVRQASNFLDLTEWPQQHQWLRENLEMFYRVFGPRVKQLDGSKAILSTSQPI